MSSLMQFRGQSDNRGVGLEFYLVDSEPWYKADETEPIECSVCSTDVVTRTHAQIYRVFRKPAGMFGPWVVFRYNGDEHVPDLSHPIAIVQLPRGAERLSAEENSETWHK